MSTVKTKQFSQCPQAVHTFTWIHRRTGIFELGGMTFLLEKITQCQDAWVLYSEYKSTYILWKGKTSIILTLSETVLIPEVVIWKPCILYMLYDHYRQSILDLVKPETYQKRLFLLWRCPKILIILSKKFVFVQYFNCVCSFFRYFLYVCCLELTEQALVCLE